MKKLKLIQLPMNLVFKFKDCRFYLLNEKYVSNDIYFVKSGSVYRNNKLSTILEDLKADGDDGPLFYDADSLPIIYRYL